MRSAYLCLLPSTFKLFIMKPRSIVHFAANACVINHAQIALIYKNISTNKHILWLKITRLITNNNAKINMTTNWFSIYLNSIYF